jgi:hypothetical protein
MRCIVCKKFADKYTKELYDRGRVLDLDTERAAEVIAKLGAGFIREVSSDNLFKNFNLEELKELADGLGVVLLPEDDTKREISDKINLWANGIILPEEEESEE